MDFSISKNEVLSQLPWPYTQISIFLGKWCPTRFRDKNDKTMVVFNSQGTQKPCACFVVAPLNKCSFCIEIIDPFVPIG